MTPPPDDMDDGDTWHAVGLAVFVALGCVAALSALVLCA